MHNALLEELRRAYDESIATTTRARPKRGLSLGRSISCSLSCGAPRDEPFQVTFCSCGQRATLTRTVRFEGCRNFVRKQAFGHYRWQKNHFFVKRDHGPPQEIAVRFDAMRVTVVGRAVPSHARGAKCALVKIDERTQTAFEALVPSEGRSGP